jgi:hypothetical protein
MYKFGCIAYRSLSILDTPTEKRGVYRLGVPKIYTCTSVNLEANDVWKFLDFNQVSYKASPMFMLYPYRYGVAHNIKNEFAYCAIDEKAVIFYL